MRSHSTLHTVLVSTLVFVGGGYLAYSVTSMLGLDTLFRSSLAAVGEAVGDLAVPKPVPPEPVKPVPAAKAVLAEVALDRDICASATSTYDFKENLAVGDTNPDVAELQRILNANGYEVARTGPGSKGKESDSYDEATAAAVRKFQEANDITPSGNVGSITRFVLSTYGYVPSCEKRVAVAPSQTAKPVVATSSPAVKPEVRATTTPAKPLTTVVAAKPLPQSKRVFSRPLDLGFSGDDVKALQLYLASLPNGIYPEGYVTGNYGPFTQKAVGKFQELHGLAMPGDAAYGFVGPATREKLNSLVQ